MNSNNHYIGAEQHSAEAVSKAGSKPIERPAALAKADAFSYVLFERPDLQTQRDFLRDFGMQVAAEDDQALYLRGHGPSSWFYCASKGPKARFLGAGYELTSEQQLLDLAAKTGRPIEDIEGPGGGQRLRLRDPDGFIVDCVFGRQKVERLDCRDQLFSSNTPQEKVRINTTIRSSAAPTPLEKLGHMVLSVSNFEESAQWYMQHLGLIPTDVQCVADGTPVLAFLRCDRGETPADHHTLVLVQNIAPALMHTAYEALDIDSIGQGAQYLRWKGWQHFWGIGRHILGSQIFDYWLDPYGAEVEHYADGDVFTADHPTRYHLFDQGSLYTWGHDLPPAPKPSPLVILKLLLSGKARTLPRAVGKMRAALAVAPRPWIK